MGSKADPRRPARRPAAVLAPVLCAALLAGPAAGSAAPALQPVVGTVQTLARGALSVTHQGEAVPAALRSGSRLREGDTITVGPGTSATVRLTVPRGRRAGRELVDFKPVSGAHATLKLKRTGRVITVTVSS